MKHLQRPHCDASKHFDNSLIDTIFRSLNIPSLTTSDEPSCRVRQALQCGCAEVWADRPHDEQAPGLCGGGDETSAVSHSNKTPEGTALHSLSEVSSSYKAF